MTRIDSFGGLEMGSKSYERLRGRLQSLCMQLEQAVTKRYPSRCELDRRLVIDALRDEIAGVKAQLPTEKAA